MPSRSLAFSPPLPRAKAEAIRRLGFGTIVKVVMAFAPSDVFWDDRPDFLGGVGDGADDEYCALVGADGGIW